MSTTKMSQFELESNIDENIYVIGLKENGDTKKNIKYQIGQVISSVNGRVDDLFDDNGKIKSTILPSFVDDVLEYASQSAFPSAADAEKGKIYVALDTNKTYRWSGTQYVEISASLALGETSSTAYYGDKGKIAYDHSQTAGDAFSGFNKLTTNSEGHVTGATAVSKSDLNAVHIDWSSVDDKPSTYTPSTHDHTKIVTEGDNRSVNTQPNDYSSSIRFRGLKRNDAVGLPEGATYSYFVGLRGWPESSGGPSHEFAFDPRNLYWRTGSTTSWGDWYQIITTKNVDTQPIENSVKVITSGAVYSALQTKLGAVTANGYVGMAKPDGTTSDWIRTTSSGLLPTSSGNPTNGHSDLGTSSWYFRNAYIQKVYNTENHIGDCTIKYDSSLKCLNFDFV